MKKSKRILIIDDDLAMRDSCRKILKKGSFQVEEATNGEAGILAAREASYDIILLDLKMPGLNGFQTLGRLKEANSNSSIIVITGYADIDSAVEVMRKGAIDFIPKPFTPEKLRNAINNILKQKNENDLPDWDSSKTWDKYSIIGKSPEIRNLKKLIAQVATTDSTVLITGESGTGKELFTRALHNLSNRKNEPFIVVDCCTLMGTIFESELFGHLKGAYTGAGETTHGRIELADGGTLFFDEIGNMTLDIQAKLLRLIEEREFVRIGSNQLIKVNVRIVAATNINLQEAIRQNTFREDLYYRLCVVPITIPPLREHKEDIPLLIEHFIKEFTHERKKTIKSASPEVIGLLTKHDWHGNVRELRNAIERAVILCNSDTIQKKDILNYGYSDEQLSQPSSSLDLKTVEAEHIRSVLKRTNGNRQLAAKYLGIDRKTLWRKMKEYKIEA